VDINFYGVQRKTIEFGKKTPYSIYALDMGLGKSLCAAATAHETRSKLLYICPSYGIYNFKREIEKFYPDKVVSLLRNDKAIYKLWDTDVAILPYYFLDKADILFEWADMVAFDEAQYLKHMETKRTQAAHRLVYENSIERVLFLSGTLAENRVYELYSVMAMCQYDPKIQDSEFLKRFPSYVDFANYFSNLEEFDMQVKGKKGGAKTVTVQQWRGVKNVKELRELLAPNFIKFYLEDAVELPASIDIPVYTNYKDNPKLEESFLRFQADGEMTGVSSDIKLKAAMATVDFTIGYVKDLLDQGLKVVVFSDHPEPAAKIAEALGVKSIDGSTDVKVRHKMAEEFQNGETDRICATIGALSTTVNLHTAQDLVCNDLPWKPSSEDQMRGRIKRIGQKGRPRYHYIYGTIQSEKIRKALDEKRQTLRQIIG